MKYTIYAKTTEDIEIFNDVLRKICSNEDKVYFCVENKRCFRELKKLKESLKGDEAIIVSGISTLGLSNGEIAEQLKWFIDKEAILIINDVPSTYEYEINQPLNKAVLTTILQSILKVEIEKRNDTISFSKNNAGRRKIEFPYNWEELYEKWQSGRISSKEFIQLSGLKKATFYNLVTEYKEIQDANNKYTEKYMAN